MNTKRRRGDRKDGKLVRGLDSMHIFMPLLLPDRTDNEAVANDEVDLTALQQFLDKKNSDGPEYKYTIFHAVLAALAKTFALRPRMNYFIANAKYYERNDIVFSFVAKKKIADDGEESIVRVVFDRASGISALKQMHDSICGIVYGLRKENKTDGATDIMDFLCKLPRFLLKMIVGIMHWLDRHGWMPKDVADTDPYYSSVFITNLGSIRTNAAYHHLANWGTNSIFLVIGEKMLKPVFNADGSHQMRELLPFSFILDERIADGVYFTKSIKIFKHLLLHPELLETAAEEEVVI